MANLYTKTGDRGTTALVGGSRISKSDPRVECYGTIDEANSVLGLARSQIRHEYICATIKSIQGKLFSLGAELASDEAGIASLKERLTDSDVVFLEQVVDRCTETIGKQTRFVIPGVDQGSASLHMARTVIRRAERRMVELNQSGRIREVLSRYVNRLSDTLYALARLQEEAVLQESMQQTITELVREKLSESSRSTATQLPMTLDNLRKLADRAQIKSRELGVPIVFAAVDEGGTLILLERMENSLLGSVDVAAGKAYTANAFKMPTHVLGKESQAGGSLYGIENSSPGKIVLFGGGFPYLYGGRVVGGIGISGGTVEQDMQIAQFAMSL